MFWLNDIDQAEDHHLNHEAQGWQHHGVGFFAAGGTGAFQQIWDHKEGRLSANISTAPQDIR